MAIVACRSVGTCLQEYADWGQQQNELDSEDINEDNQKEDVGDDEEDEEDNDETPDNSMNDCKTCSDDSRGFANKYKAPTAKSTRMSPYDVAVAITGEKYVLPIMKSIPQGFMLPDFDINGRPTTKADHWFRFAAEHGDEVAKEKLGKFLCSQVVDGNYMGDWLPILHEGVSCFNSHGMLPSELSQDVWLFLARNVPQCDGDYDGALRYVGSLLEKENGLMKRYISCMYINLGFEFFDQWKADDEDTRQNWVYDVRESLLTIWDILSDEEFRIWANREPFWQQGFLQEDDQDFFSSSYGLFTSVINKWLDCAVLVFQQAYQFGEDPNEERWLKLPLIVFGEHNWEGFKRFLTWCATTPIAEYEDDTFAPAFLQLAIQRMIGNPTSQENCSTVCDETDLQTLLKPDDCTLFQVAIISFMETLQEQFDYELSWVRWILDNASFLLEYSFVTDAILKLMGDYSDDYDQQFKEQYISILQELGDENDSALYQLAHVYQTSGNVDDYMKTLKEVADRGFVKGAKELAEVYANLAKKYSDGWSRSENTSKDG